MQSSGGKPAVAMSATARLRLYAVWRGRIPGLVTIASSSLHVLFVLDRGDGGRSEGSRCPETLLFFEAIGRGHVMPVLG